MKKRCTQSSCRRVYNASMGACPYCNPAPLSQVFLLEPTTSRLALIKVYRAAFGLGLREGKDLLDAGTGCVAVLPKEEAEALAAAMLASGAKACVKHGGKKGMETLYSKVFPKRQAGRL